jgi:hypothetical protein
MRRTSRLWVVLFALFISTAAWATVPQTLHFSGKLDTAGGAFTGSIEVTFALYDGPDAVSSFWSETQAVSVQNGRFHVELGNTTTLSAASVDVAALHLGVTVDTDDEMALVPISSVPYAFRATEAGNAKTVGGQAATAFAAVVHSHALADLEHPGCTSGQVLTSDGSGWICGTAPVLTETDPQVGSNTINTVPKWDDTALVAGSITDKDGKVGIGTTTPGYRLAVNTGAVGGGGIQLTSQTYDAQAGSPFSHYLLFSDKNSDNGSIQFRHDGTASYFRLTVGGMNATETVMTLQEDGNVGIGTTNPQHKLHLQDPGNQAADFIFKTATAPSPDVGGSISAAIITNSGSIDGSFHMGFEIPANDANDGFFVSTDADLDGTVDTVALKINAAGNVGIGTTSPTQLLHVNGQAQFGTATTRSIVEIHGSTTASGYVRFINNLVGGNSWGIGAGVFGGPDAFNIWDVTGSSGTTGLTIKSSGKVGIGTVSPSTTLEVSGTVKATAFVGDGSGLANVTVIESDPKVAMSTLDSVPRWDGTQLDDSAVTVSNVGTVVSAGTLSSTADIGSLAPGTRLAWYPSRSAFRAGTVDGTQWDNGNVGLYSTAMGYATTASGGYSMAVGFRSKASGDWSTAMGYDTTASGETSTAMGTSTTASGSRSTAMGGSSVASGYGSTAIGWASTASGEKSTAFGYKTMAQAPYSMAMGTSINVGTTADHSIAIGLAATASPSTISNPNTLAIMNGKVGIGVVNPSEALEVSGSVKAQSIKFSDGTEQTTAAPSGSSSGGVGALMYVYKTQSCPSGWTKHVIGVNTVGATDVDACYRTQGHCLVMYVYKGQTCPSAWTKHVIGVNIMGGTDVDGCFYCN